MQIQARTGQTKLMMTRPVPGHPAGMLYGQRRRKPVLVHPPGNPVLVHLPGTTPVLALPPEATLTLALPPLPPAATLVLALPPRTSQCPLHRHLSGGDSYQC